MVGSGANAVGRRGAARPLMVEVAVRDGNAIMAIGGELDVATVGRYRAVVAAIVEVPGVARIQIDGRRIDFVDAVGLGGLLTSRIDAELVGVSWFIGPASVSLRRLLDLAGLRGVLADPAVN